MPEVNGLPIEILVILGGIILVLASWALVRFGKVIARAVIVGAAVIIGAIVALAVLAQSASSFQTAQAAERVAKVAQTSANTNMLMVALVGLFGGVALTAVLGALGFAGYVWIKSQRQQTALSLPRRQTQIEQPMQAEPVVWYVGQEQQQHQDVDLSRMGW